MENLYNLLGVSYTVNNEQLKKAYVALLKKYHPDVFEGNKKQAEDYTAKVNVAYSVLSSPKERLSYDRTIFPESYSKNYYYDDEGNRVPIIKQTQRFLTEAEYDSLPPFSFFNKSKLSEMFEFYRSLTPAQKTERKRRKKQKKIDIKQQRIKEKELQIQSKLQKEKNKINSLDVAPENFEKGRKKLDFAIIIIILLLITLIGLIVVLNILQAN